METLSARVIRGGLWLVAQNATGQLLGVVRLFILARLLTPHDFGLIGIGMMLLALYEAYSNLGTQLALIQRQDRGRDMFDTAWTLGLIRGVLGAALQLALAPTIAAFFRAPDALPIIRSLAAVPILRALTNIGLVALRQELAFRPQYLIYTVATLSEIAVAVLLAIWLGNAWALVGGTLTSYAVMASMSYLLHPYRPTLRFDRAHARELVVYGRWVLGASALTNLLASGVQAVVGRALGVEVVGLYRVAQRVAQLPATGVTRVLSPVTIAAYARLQDSPERLRGAYVRTFNIVTLAVVPISVGIVLYGADLVEVVLGGRWRAVVPLLQVMSVFGLARAIGDTTDPLFAGSGRPWLRTWVQGVELVLVALTIGPLLVMAGAVGVAWSVSAGALGAETVALWAASRLLRIPGRRMLGILAWPLLACLPAGALRLWLLGPLHAPIPLVGALALSGLLYVVGLVLLDRTKLHPIGSVIDTEPWRRGVALLWKDMAGR